MSVTVYRVGSVTLRIHDELCRPPEDRQLRALGAVIGACRRRRMLAQNEPSPPPGPAD
mgnify:CR=1 FL=1